MNERIRELASQAKLMAEEDINRQISYNAELKAFAEKFAELIVRECCDQLVKEGNDWEQFSRNPPDGQETNASAALFAAYRLKEDAVDMLEEHFGINNTL